MWTAQKEHKGVVVGRNEQFEINDSSVQRTEDDKDNGKGNFYDIILCNVALPTSTPNVTSMEREMDTEEAFYGKRGQVCAARRQRL
jgi:hypothetical protein